MLDDEKIKQIIEGALLASDGPLTVAQITQLFQPGDLHEENASGQIRDALKALQSDCEQRGVELKKVASGYRYQVRQELSEWVSHLWDEKPPRYTRALLETLALVAYKQPVTRGDIEQVRGVSVSQNIMRTLLERDWIKVVGQKEVPGRPSLFGTTKAFLDYFNLSSLNQLPPLPEIRQLIEPVLAQAEEASATADQGDNADAASAMLEEDAEKSVADDAGHDDSEGNADEGSEIVVGSVSIGDERKAAVEVEIDTEAETAEVVPLRPGMNPS